MVEALKPTLAPLVLRLCLATIFISHGYFKIAVAPPGDHWFEGGAPGAPVPSPTLQLMVAWGELVGGIALGVGLLTRLAALGLGIIQLGAVALITGSRDFIFIGHEIGSSPSGHGFSFRTVGFEYNAALMMMCLTLIILGSGRLSIDYLIFGRRRITPPVAPPETAPPVKPTHAAHA